MSSTEKKRRLTSAAESAAATPPIVNSLRLVQRANLPRVLELEVLGYLSVIDLCAFPMLSKDMYSLTKSYLEQAQSLVVNSRRFGGPDSVDDLALLRFCSSLRTVTIGGHVTDKAVWSKIQGLLCSIVLKNAATLTDLRVEKHSIPLINALSQCPNLIRFHYAGTSDFASVHGNCGATTPSIPLSSSIACR